MGLTVETVVKRSFETRAGVGSEEKIGNSRTDEVTEEGNNEKLMERMSRCKGDGDLWRRGEQ